MQLSDLKDNSFAFCSAINFVSTATLILAGFSIALAFRQCPRRKESILFAHAFRSMADFVDGQNSANQNLPAAQ